MTDDQPPSVPWLLGYAQLTWINDLIAEGKSADDALDTVMAYLTPRAQREVARHRSRIIAFVEGRQ